MKLRENDLVYFNNSYGYNHAENYGVPDAFFDLNSEGNHAKLVVGLPEGQECVVVGKADSKQRLPFSWYFLTNEIRSAEGTRVFLGDYTLTETRTKPQALKHKIYGRFFNVDRHLKRASAVIRQVPPVHRPTHSLSRPSLIPDEVDKAKGPYPEGATRTITVNAYERSAKARQECKKHYGTTCSVCGFSFEKAYGDVAADFIHVHHLKPLSKIKQEYQVDPVRDMRPVCANCHAVIHLGGANRKIEEVKQLLRGKPSSWFGE